MVPPSPSLGALRCAHYQVKPCHYPRELDSMPSPHLQDRRVACGPDGCESTRAWGLHLPGHRTGTSHPGHRTGTSHTLVLPGLRPGWPLGVGALPAGPVKPKQLVLVSWALLPVSDEEMEQVCPPLSSLAAPTHWALLGAWGVMVQTGRFPLEFTSQQGEDLCLENEPRGQGACQETVMGREGGG